MRWVRRVFLSLVAVASLGILAASPAGATPVPCNIGNQGWYASGPWSMHCVIDGNHLTIDQYWTYDGSKAGLALEAWIPMPEVYYYILAPGAGQESAVYFCPATWLGVDIVSPGYTYVPGWEEQFLIIRSNNTTSYAGVLNHWHGSGGLWAYRNHRDLQNCPYGGGGYRVQYF